jgi:hypothetical protein
MLVWRYLDQSGSRVGRSEEFDHRDAAEAWLGQAWGGLLEEGVESVELTEEDELVYRMSLREEPP